MPKKYRYIPEKDLGIGSTIGNYEIVGKVYNDKFKRYDVACKCLICGAEKVTQMSNLRNSSRKCGCRNCYVTGKYKK